MLMNQLIMFNLVSKGKESSIYPAFPIWTVPLVNQIDKAKFLSLEVFQIKGMIATFFKPY